MRTRIYQTYHYFEPQNNWRLVSTPSYQTNGPAFTEEFHTFGMAWEPGQIIWYVDGKETHRIKDADFHVAGQAMYILANLAVGGTWPGTPAADVEFPAVFEIDWIRAYKKKVRTRPVRLADYQLEFGDEFNGSTLDADKWNTRFLWGPFNLINNEQQYYVDANGVDASLGYSPFDVSGGNLTIRAEAADASPPTLPREQPPQNDPFFGSNRSAWYTAGVRESPTTPPASLPPTMPSSSPMATPRCVRRYPEGDGLWPAFWLLNAYYVGPQPEIDIMEVLGENTSRLYTTFHYFNKIGKQQRIPAGDSGQDVGVDLSAGFHTYGVQWMPGQIIWYLDGQPIRTVTDENVPYQIMYVIANLAVGGNFNTRPLDPSKIPAELVIDYIRVYQERDTP